MELSVQYLILFVALLAAIILERMGQIILAVIVFFGTGFIVACAFN